MNLEVFREVRGTWKKCGGFQSNLVILEKSRRLLRNLKTSGKSGKIQRDLGDYEEILDFREV